MVQKDEFQHSSDSNLNSQNDISSFNRDTLFITIYHHYHQPFIITQNKTRMLTWLEMAKNHLFFQLAATLRVNNIFQSASLIFIIHSMHIYNLKSMMGERRKKVEPLIWLLCNHNCYYQGNIDSSWNQWESQIESERIETRFRVERKSWINVYIGKGWIKSDFCVRYLQGWIHPSMLVEAE